MRQRQRDRWRPHCAVMPCRCSALTVSTSPRPPRSGSRLWSRQALRGRRQGCGCAA